MLWTPEMVSRLVTSCLRYSRLAPLLMVVYHSHAVAVDAFSNIRIQRTIASSAFFAASEDNRMFLTFLRHGSVAALVAGVAVEILAFLLGEIAVKPLMILLGASMFYFSEYGMHRFAFHAPPLAW